MKKTLILTALIGMSAAALLTAQVRQPVILAGGAPAAPQVNVLPDGSIGVAFPNAGGLVLPGRPPVLFFTNDLGQIVVVWPPAAPQPPLAVPPVVAPPAVPEPPPPPVVVTPTNRPPVKLPDHIFIGDNGQIGIVR